MENPEQEEHDKNQIQQEQVHESVPVVSEKKKRKYSKSIRLPLTLTQNDKDLFRIFDSLEKGEMSQFTRKMLRYGIRYCIENRIDFFENTTKDRNRIDPENMFNTDIVREPNVPVLNIDLESEPEALSTPNTGGIAKNGSKKFDIEAALAIQMGEDELDI